MATSAESSSLAVRLRQQSPVLATALLALGSLALLVVVPDEPGTVALAVVGAIALVVVAATSAVTGELADALFASLVFVVLTVGTWTLLAADTSLLVVALVLVGVVALVSYGLHRYELVALGLVEATDE